MCFPIGNQRFGVEGWPVGGEAGGVVPGIPPGSVFTQNFPEFTAPILRGHPHGGRTDGLDTDDQHTHDAHRSSVGGVSYASSEVELCKGGGGGFSAAWYGVSTMQFEMRSWWPVLVARGGLAQSR